MSSSSITRENDDSGLRWYEDEDGNRHMSVTTVLKNFLGDGTEDDGLKYWKLNNQGEGDDMHHQHVYWYSGPRGTLAHYHCLNPLADEELWGEEEQKSMRQIVWGPTADEIDEASRLEEDIVYSILYNHDVVDDRDTFRDLLSHTKLYEIAIRDIEWVRGEFNRVADELGVLGNVIAVERFLLDTVDGFGGQCDLLYEDPGGNVVLADLKTSSSLREDHVIQPIAYGAAVERTDELPDTVDRHEVIRLCPDSKEAVVHSHERPQYMDGVEWYQTDDWFSDSYGDYSYDSIDEMHEEFKECIELAKEATNDSQQ